VTQANTPEADKSRPSWPRSACAGRSVLPAIATAKAHSPGPSSSRGRWPVLRAAPRETGHASVSCRTATFPSRWLAGPVRTTPTCLPFLKTRNAVEAALQDERAARVRAERGLQDALATIRDLQTKLGHAELAYWEALEAARSARDAAEALQAEHREREACWHEDRAAGRAVAEAALPEAALARGCAERTLPEASTARPASSLREASAKPAAKASAQRQAKVTRKAAAASRQREPQPVKWWLKTAKR